MKYQTDETTRAAEVSQAFRWLVTSMNTWGWSRMVTSKNKWTIWYEIRAIAREVMKSR